uniref:Glycosyltransferase 2-like domain-containing protein n=1 Tax=Roseihalotalea indica TaxID=2867963 RepID=A0AA49JH42_9BACT|nr:hypothetical protein K4G66_02675 [Tunicatimonas sp. TK19036]
MAEVSIIIPTYNEEHSLPDTLQGVMQLSPAAKEIIVAVYDYYLVIRRFFAAVTTFSNAVVLILNSLLWKRPICALK